MSPGRLFGAKPRPSLYAWPFLAAANSRQGFEALNRDRSVVDGRGTVLLQRLQEPVDRLTTDTDHYRKVLLRQAQIDPDAALPAPPMPLGETKQLMRQNLERAAIALGYQRIDRDPEIVGEQICEGGVSSPTPLMLASIRTIGCAPSRGAFSSRASRAFSICLI